MNTRERLIDAKVASSKAGIAREQFGRAQAVASGVLSMIPLPGSNDPRSRKRFLAVLMTGMGRIEIRTHCFSVNRSILLAEMQQMMGVNTII